MKKGMTAGELKVAREELAELQDGGMKAFALAYERRFAALRSPAPAVRSRSLEWLRLYGTEAVKERIRDGRERGDDADTIIRAVVRAEALE